MQCPLCRHSLGWKTGLRILLGSRGRLPCRSCHGELRYYEHQNPFVHHLLGFGGVVSFAVVALGAFNFGLHWGAASLLGAVVGGGVALQGRRMGLTLETTEPQKQLPTARVVDQPDEPPAEES